MLELPRSGPSLVPCLDMANHSTEANAYYEETPGGDVVLLPRPDREFSGGDEITISYGSDKSAAEMLFSYGFLTPSSVAYSLTLPLSPLPEDPLGKAKQHIFTEMPSIQIKLCGDKVDWSSPFAYLSCLNEEDGLHFKLLQSSDGDTELRMFWQEDDVTSKDESFEMLVSEHELYDVFKLRVNMVVTQKIQDQLERLGDTHETKEAASDTMNATNARELRRVEEDILGRTAASLEDQVSAPIPNIPSSRQLFRAPGSETTLSKQLIRTCHTADRASCFTHRLGLPCDCGSSGWKSRRLRQ